MSKPIVILFYKKLITLGGAEVLLVKHYSYLKSQGYAPKVLCFEFSDMDRVSIAQEDLIRVEGAGTLSKTYRLAKVFSTLKAQQVFCHSGHIEFGIAAHWARIVYSVFLHHPTTMSYNETNKYALRYFKQYKNFAPKDNMYKEIVEVHQALSFRQHIYINFRAALSQWILKSAAHLFVLSNYAVREKKEIFGLSATYLSGAISEERLAGLLVKTPPKQAAEDLTVVTISRLDENKRIALLIDAIAIMRAQGSNIRLIIGGTGPNEAQLKKQVTTLGLNAHIAFLGYVLEKDIDELYASMDMFVSIDWADFRITTYEVLCANRRVLVSDNTEVDTDLLQSGYLHVSAPDKEELASHILNALQTPVTWNQLRLKDYLQEYTWPNYFRSIEKVMLACA